jgi:hypothetical protein
MLGCSDNCANVLVRAGRLLGDTARGRAADQNALRRQFILDFASAPLLKRRMALHRTAGAMAGGRECLLLGRDLTDKNIRGGSHAAADQNRLPDRTKRCRQTFVTGTEGARRTFSVNKQLATLAVDHVRFDLAGIVRDIE